MISLTFLMMKSLPGDPFSEEKALPAEVVQSLRHHYALDTPISTQYFHYLKSVVTLDFGPSIVHPSKTVGSIIATSFPVSAVIGCQALILSLSIGVASGILSAHYNKKWTQTLLKILGVFLISVPSFILATVLQYVFGIYHNVLPIANWGTWEHTVLPTIALAVYPTAVIARLVRSQMVKIMKLDYVKNAKAKGLSQRDVLIYHVLPNSLIPTIGYMGQLISSVLVGSFVVEKIFGIPGLGLWFVASIMNRDYPVIMGTALFYSALLTLFIFLSDCLYCLVDPRIELKGYARA